MADIPPLSELLTMTKEEMLKRSESLHGSNIVSCLVDREIGRRRDLADGHVYEVTMWLYQNEKHLVPVLKERGYTIRYVTPNDIQVVWFVKP